MTSSRIRLLMLALFCAAVLLPRVGGPHLHLCLDGAAPAVYLHVADDDTGRQLPDAGHEDLSIDMSGPVIGKLSPQGFAGLLLTAVLLVFVALRQTPMLSPPSPNVAVPQAPPFLRPQLRGPPA